MRGALPPSPPFPSPMRIVITNLSISSNCIQGLLKHKLCKTRRVVYNVDKTIYNSIDEPSYMHIFTYDLVPVFENYN